MMLVTSTRAPPSCLARLPQKFSAATTSSVASVVARWLVAQADTASSAHTATRVRRARTAPSYESDSHSANRSGYGRLTVRRHDSRPERVEGEIDGARRRVPRARQDRL